MPPSPTSRALSKILLRGLTNPQLANLRQHALAGTPILCQARAGLFLDYPAASLPALASEPAPLTAFRLLKEQGAILVPHEWQATFLSLCRASNCLLPESERVRDHVTPYWEYVDLMERMSMSEVRDAIFLTERLGPVKVGLTVGGSTRLSPQPRTGRGTEFTGRACSTG